MDFSESPDLPPIHTVFHSEYFKDVMAEWFSKRTMLENFHARPTFFDVSAIAPPRQLVCVCDECRNNREEGLKVRIA